MGSFKFLILSVFALLFSMAIISCDGDDGQGAKTKECSAPADCKASQDCVFDSLDAEKGVCKSRVVCDTKDDCSDGLLCLDDDGKKYCGSKEVFGIKSITLPEAKKDEPYTDADGNMIKLEVTGSGAEYYFEVVDPSKLPEGLKLSSEGNLSGTVTAELGEYTFTVKAVNGPKDAKHYYNYKSVTEEFTIKVVEGEVKCKVDSCTEPHKGVCNVVDGEIVCSCDEGYQDNDENGTCEETCATAKDNQTLECNERQHCDDSSGTATCVCNENWKDDGNGGKCNVCVDGMHENPDDPTACDPDVRTVTCTNVPDPSEATWADAFEDGTFEQTWVNNEYVPNVDPDKCAWKCLDENKVHDTDAGKCICKAGLVDDGNGGCKAPCTDNQITNADGTCSCYPGYGGDDCLSCADGYKATNNGLCKFDCSGKANSHVNSTNDGCECDEGYFLNDSGECINPCEGVDCGDISKVCVAVDVNTTNCICDAGLNFVDDGNGNCGCDTENTHRVLASTGDSCECDSANNYVEDLDGTCVLDTECTVDSFTAADPTNNSYDNAADITDDLADGSAHYDDLNNQDASCNSSEDWYKVTVGANKKLTVRIDFVNDDGNLNLKLYVGGDGYNNDIEYSTHSNTDYEEVKHIFREETDVYIKVYGSTYSMVRNKYSMDVKVEDVAPISNLDGGDSCEDAVEITQSGVYHGTTADKNNTMTPSCSTSNAPEVFYKVTPTQNVKLDARVRKEYFDGVLYLIDSCGATDSIACHDGFSSDHIEANLEAGKTYYIVVDGWHSESGEFNLEVEFIGSQAPAECDPACDSEREVCKYNDNNEPECVCNEDENYFYNGTTCVNPCSAVTCGENAHCEAQNALTTECVCDEGYKMFNGSCQTYVANNGGDTCEDAVEISSGLYSGTTVGMNDDLGGCDETATEGAGFGGDVFYKFTVDHEVKFYSILKTTGDTVWNPVLRLYKAHEGDDACALTAEDKLYCKDQDLLSGKAEAIEYDLSWDYVYMVDLQAGTYYLIVDGNNDGVNDNNPVAAEGEFELEVNFGNPCYENTCDTDKEVCVPDYSTGLSDDSYTCQCNNDDGYFEDEEGNCVNPCDSAECPDAASHGSETCKATSLTDYTCGCEDNYFEVVSEDGTRTCESACDLDSAPDCSGLGEHVECRASSATEASCGCEQGYMDMDSGEGFACVEDLSVNTCDDDALYTITESGVLYGTTKNATNDYDPGRNGCTDYSERGADVVYAVAIPDGYTLSASLNPVGNVDVALYLLSDCSDPVNSCEVGQDGFRNPEVINYENTTGSDVTYYIVVDGYSSSKKFDYELTVNLTPPPLCGNGTIDTDEGEECDASAADPLNGETCAIGGTLACDDECHFDRSGCWECLQDSDCTDANKPVCYVDTHTCGAAEAECGNNTIESPEECDGTATFDKTCPEGMVGEKSCIAPGLENECTIDESTCELCEDSLTLNAEPNNKTKDNAVELTMDGNTKTWNDLVAGEILNNACVKSEDWYKINVPANTKISVDILFIDDDGDLDLKLYKEGSTIPVASSTSSSDNEHVDNDGKIDSSDKLYYIQVKPYGSSVNTYDMIIKLEETCNIDSDCSTAGDVCINNVCYDSNPCDNADCSSKPNSTCQPLNGTEYECECNDGYSELDGQCLEIQSFNGADTCGDGSSLPVISHSGIFTGSVSSDDTTLSCSSGGKEVFYRIDLLQDSYLKVEETRSLSDFNANLALRSECDSQEGEIECNAYGDKFDGYFQAGIYYLVVEAYNSSSVDYRIEVTIKADPCNNVTCDNINGTGQCIPGDEASSYICECNEGYFFDGNSSCVNPCSDDTCANKPNSSCVATSATEFTCQCNEGYWDDNGTCVTPCDGNTCDTETEVCVPTGADTYECQCADGYFDNGTDCVEDLAVDDCSDPDLYVIDASGSYYGTTSGYSHDYDCGAGSGNDAFYAVDLNAGDEINVTLSSDQDTVLFLMKSCSNEDANCLVEKDSGYSGDPESFSFTANEPGRYIIGLRRYSSSRDMNYTLEVEITRNTPSATIGWCNTQWPKTVAANDTVVYGQVYVEGITDVTTDTGSDRISAQLCYYANGQSTSDATCIDATFNKSVENSDNDEYMATLTGLEPGTYFYYFRFKTSDDSNYFLCDLNDTRNGTAYNNGETFNGDVGEATISSQQSSLVTNGDFETWGDDGMPAGWTNVDSGVELNPGMEQVHGGTYSLAVTVNTGTQGDTDVRQTINVVNGTTYNVSAWVYHPSGTHIKVRLYYGTYGDYSNNTVVDGWQEVTGQFTASSDTVDVGFRFYDQEGFNVGEQVFIDDFTITPQ